MPLHLRHATCPHRRISRLQGPILPHRLSLLHSKAVCFLRRKTPSLLLPCMALLLHLPQRMHALIPTALGSTVPFGNPDHRLEKIMQKHQWTQKVIGSCLALFVTASWGQPSPAQLQMQQQQINNMLGEVQTQDTLRRRGVINQQQNAARQQAWQAKENAIQAQIERYQSTSYYGSLITQGNTNILHWGGGGNISKAASERNALSHCHEGQCRILLTVSNGCIGASRPESATDSLHWTLAVDKDPQKAIEKSYFACEKKYGVNQCIYASNPLKSSKSSATNHTDAFCSGYDYGAYTKK